jgi:hypothetical protein
VSITVHLNTAQGIAHLRVVGPATTRPAEHIHTVSAGLTEILGEVPIEGPAGAHLWLLELLPGDSRRRIKLHSQLLLCELDASDEAEVQSETQAALQ